MGTGSSNLGGVKWDDYDAALFDLDGVLTPTALVHMRAWDAMFNAFLRARGVAEPYTEQDYFDHVDGKPRYQGVQDFLAARGIDLPYGDPADAEDDETVCGLGNRKNAEFTRVLRRDGVQPYPASVTLLDHLAERGTALAVVSSSRNATDVLEVSGLRDRFRVVVDGVVASRERLAGKPEPDTFGFAAEQLGVAHGRSVVLEDAISGVQAGRAGRFGAVIGVDRGVGGQALRRAGADVVVRELDELVAR